MEGSLTSIHCANKDESRVFSFLRGFSFPVWISLGASLSVSLSFKTQGPRRAKDISEITFSNCSDIVLDSASPHFLSLLVFFWDEGVTIAHCAPSSQADPGVSRAYVSLISFSHSETPRRASARDRRRGLSEKLMRKLTAPGKQFF